MKKACAASLALALLLAGASEGGEALVSVLPAASGVEAISSLSQVVGVELGEDVPDSEQVLRLAREIAARWPQRVRLVEYARSLEGRDLVLLIIAAPENLARLPEIRADLARLGDIRTTEAGAIVPGVDELPAILWIAGSVHGDEASGGDAALALATYLAASRSAEVETILANLVVVIDPLQNPDGRARFVASLRQARGIEADPEPTSAEHEQPWPGGRFSHDLFDLNRDWFALTHPETAGRVRAMLEWHPTVVVDLHEMGAEMGYFFAPPATPVNPLLAPGYEELIRVVARANAAAFDARGWRYWTGEIFDSFYPGYGETWPSLGGAIGMTYEQASARGRVTRLKDGTLLEYRATVQHHLLAAFSTCQEVASERARFLKAWAAFRRDAVTDGRKGPLQAFLLEEGGDPTRAAALADLLVRQGIEVSRSDGSGLPAPGFVVPLAQPLGRLARCLLQRQTAMGSDFEKEQERRDSKRLPDEIYDVTAWSLPLLWGVPTRELAGLPSAGTLTAVKAGDAPPGAVRGEGRVGYLLAWRGIEAAQALAASLRAKVDVSVAAKPFVVGGRRFDRGTLVVRRAANPEDLAGRMSEIARRFGVEVFGVDSGLTDEGIDLGSNEVLRVTAPRVALAWDVPTAASGAGDVRYTLERVVGYPITVVRTASLATADLSHFDVIILPESWSARGTYMGVLGERGLGRIGQWVSEGGVLVAIGEGASALTEEKVALLSSKVEKRGGGVAEPKEGEKAVEPDPGKRPFDYQAFVTPQQEQPPLVPGAVLRVELDREHLLAAGFPGGSVNVLVNSRRSFLPLKLDRGANVGIYAPTESLVQAGFVLEASLQLLPRKAFLMVERRGRGSVIAFAEDPAARGMTRDAMLLLANAVFFGTTL